MSSLTDATDLTPPRPYGGPGDGWIGVDLDGTLATYGTFSTWQRIGRPVKEMVKRIRHWQALGYEVRIVTARATMEDAIAPIKQWLRKRKLGELVVTCQIDRDCLQLWDDRAVGVVRNTGQIHRSPSISARPRAPVLEDAFPHENRPRLEDSHG